MRVLVVHNFYQQPGGEDMVFAAETSLLRRYGHEVFEYTDSNDRINSMNKMTAAVNTIWSHNSKRKVIDIIDRVKPDVAHFHNTFLLVSPSAYYACKEKNVPVIQSLHNPRLLCPGANLYRNGKVCEECVGKTAPWPGVIHGCYRNSRTQTAIISMMLTLHRMLRTWDRIIDIYIVFTESYRKKFIEGGLHSEKIALKPHFVDPDPGCRESDPGDYALFVGRFDKVKGIHTLLEAWKHTKDIPLNIIGYGNLLREIEDFICRNPSIPVKLVGRLNKQQLFNYIKNARFVVWPYEGYSETFGLVAIEAFACGVPVIASGAENVRNGCTGLHFAPGDAEDLSAKVNWAWNNPQKMVQMGKAARMEYQTHYTAEKNYKMLLDIYEMAISKR